MDTPPPLPVLPTYGQVQEEIEWLENDLEVDRTIKICYNPCPDPSGHGGIDSLDATIDDYAEGLGVYTLRMTSDPVSLFTKRLGRANLIYLSLVCWYLASLASGL
jgi:hypothetical protein